MASDQLAEQCTAHDTTSALRTRTQAVGYGQPDSPAGLAAFFLWHPGFAEWAYGDDSADLKTKDDRLDDISLYWLTGTVVSSGRLYWENRRASPTSATAMKTAEISVPVGVTVFPDDVYRPPRTWAEHAYPKLVYFHEVDKGGTSPPGSRRSCSARKSGPHSGSFARAGRDLVADHEGGI